MSGEDILIRDCTTDDMAAVTAIYAYEVLHHLASYEEEPPALGEMLARRQKVLDAGLPYLVAEIDGKVVGYSYAGFFHARAAYRFTIENTVYIAEAAQRCGVGHHLMIELIERCTASGFRQMIAVVGNSSQSGSIRLHEKLGFRMVGELTATGFKHGQWVDTAYMQLALGTGASAPPSDN